MKAYKLGVVLIILLVAGAFFIFERAFLPARLSRFTHVQPPKPKEVSPEIQPEMEGLDTKRAIVFKRAFEKPGEAPFSHSLVGKLAGESLLGSRFDRPTGFDGAGAYSHTLFPKPASIAAAVDFWKLVYTRYSSDEIIIHDDTCLDKIYAVLDFSDFYKKNLPDKELERLRQEMAYEKKEEIARALLQMDGYGSRTLTPFERSLWRLWESHGDDPTRFAKASGRLRTQTGQSDRLRRALERSGAYLQVMEDIFLSYSLPPELTRIVFVESMFENNALSKTGAAGMWQFMPDTARKFIKINEWVDERLDPFIATHASAKLLRSNFEELGSWPLAINAYNSGTARLKDATEALGTTDIGAIITSYREASYGFASRNFYPEFLATLEIADNYHKFFDDVVPSPPMAFEVVTLPDKARLEDIAEILELDVATIQDFNPSFLPSTFERHLPKGTMIRVPEGDGLKLTVGVYNLYNLANE